jgi:iron complex outermembrane receptor protein
MKTDMKTCALAISTALTASLGITSPVMAQTTSTPSAETLEITEIIVTARRTEERLQDVPISITVFTQEQLTKNNVTNAVDLANVTPSLSVNNNYGNENASFAIRGFVQDAGTAPSVGTYFGDVVAPRGPTQGTQAGDSVGPGAFFDLQNVQVLKGPQGTLQGRNTTGGAVLLVPVKPTGSSEGYAEVSAGNYSMHRLQAVVNSPLSDSARFRLAVDSQKRDGWLHNISGIGPSDYNDVGYTAARASLVLDLTANIENYTIGSYSKSHTNGSVQKLIAADPTGINPVDPVAGLRNFIGLFSSGQLASERARGAGFWDVEAAVPDPESTVEQWQVINTTTWRASDNLTVKNIASYAEFKDFQTSPLFGTNWQLSNLPPVYSSIFQLGIPAVFTGIFPAPGTNSADQNTYTEELQVQGNALDQRLIYQAGVYLEWSDPIAPVGNQATQLISCTDRLTLTCTDQVGAVFGVPIGAVNYTVGETTYRDKGIYAQSSYSLTDTLKLTAGARYTQDEQRNTATRISNVFLAPGAAVTSDCTDPATRPAGCVATYEKKSSKPTWLIDLDYKPTEDVLVYGKYARGYRAGGVFSNAPIDHRTFDPEKVDNFEVGVKTAWHGAVPGLFNLAAFYNNFSNQQLQIGYNAALLPGGATAPVAPTTAILNAGKSRIYGAEAELAFTPVENLNVDINYTYLNTEIREVGSVETIDVNYDAAVALAPGDPLALSPKNKFAVSGRYRLPLDRSIGDISFGATVAYTSSQLTNYNYYNPLNVAFLGGNYGNVDSRTLLNLDLGWTSIFGSGVDVTAFGTNVTNKQYYLLTPGLGSAGSRLETATVGEPRMYGVRLRYKFGE